MSKKEITPIVLDGDEYRPYDVTTDILRADTVRLNASYSTVAHTLYTLAKDTVIDNSGFKEYPHRNEQLVRHINPNTFHDALQTGPVEVLNGEWRLGFMTDTEWPDVGGYLAYRLEILTSETIAVDKFIDVEFNNGQISRGYYGTRYFAPHPDSPNVVFLYDTQFDYGRGVEIVSPPQQNPRPGAQRKSTAYVVPRKLVAGEQPKDIIRVPRFLTGEEYYSTVHANGYRG